jgi:nitrate/nitrite-specific signal transduction histidine kinase
MDRWIQNNGPASAGGDPVQLRRLKWLAVLAPLAFLIALESLRRVLIAEHLDGWVSYALLLLIALAGVWLFAEMVFGLIRRMQSRFAQQNRELLLLHEAGLDITSALDLETVLQKVVDQARDLVGARYGALSMIDQRGTIEAFLTSGISPQQRARIGPIPEGHGLLGVVLHQGEKLRLDDLSSDDRSVGFPPHHPPMRSLLAVPIVVQERIVGNLYLTEKVTAASFTESDEHTLQRFATQAALAIENARLHQQVQALAISEERERIAREMHDSLAQLIGYVNTKAQAADQFLENGESQRAREHLQQLALAAREAYADVREGILSLRAAAELDEGAVSAIRDYAERWQDQSGIPVDVAIDAHGRAANALSAIAELQLLRIVQEALSNVRKHALATRVTVQLIERDDGIEARIEDDGTGFDPAASRSSERSSIPRFGLAIMRERAAAVGGWLEITSARGEGTRVTAFVPAQTPANLPAGGTP